MWFKHRAWIPIAWFGCAANVGATYFAALPAEAWHATAHALFAVLFGLGAQHLTARRRALGLGSGAELPTDVTALRSELTALREGQSEILVRVEHSFDAIALEMERVGEGQRFLTRVLSETPRNLEGSSRSPQPDSHKLPRRSPDDEGS